MSSVSVFSGEAQFLAWGDGPSGPWVKILLPDSESLAPFRGMTAAKKGMAGQLLAVGIRELYPEPEPVEPADPAHRSLGPLALLAVRLCRDPEFLEWTGVGFTHGGGESPLKQDEARALILDVCKIGSRRELDAVPSAAEIFHREFRLPFLAYKASEAEGGEA